MNYKTPLYSVHVVRESSGSLIRETRRAISSSEGAAKLLRQHFDGLDREEFVIICMDAKNKPIGWHLVSVGTLTMSLVHPREVFKAALLLNSAGIIAAHNHPSGDVTPSPEDRTLTKRLKEAGELLGVRLLDHLILSDLEGYYSFADRGEI